MKNYPLHFLERPRVPEDFSPILPLPFRSSTSKFKHTKKNPLDLGDCTGLCTLQKFKRITLKRFDLKEINNKKKKKIES